MLIQVDPDRRDVGSSKDVTLWLKGELKEGHYAPKRSWRGSEGLRTVAQGEGQEYLHNHQGLWAATKTAFPL